MEKVIYLVSFAPDPAPDDLGLRLRDELVPVLLDRGAHRVAVNVADHHVAAPDALRITSTATPPSAAISVWIDDAVDHLRAPFDDAVHATTDGGAVAAYLVTESVALPSDRPLLAEGRVDGFAQIASFQRRADITEEAWLDTWLNDHTFVAIDLQDTFSYVQNVVTRALTPGAVPRDAIVEECFPLAALTDPHRYYDSVGDDEKLARRQREMFESVQRFIDMATIDVVTTSRYDG